jgi:hypothetical protein
MPVIDKTKYVGLANWKVTPPRPNPFEAVAGDLTEYTVHLLTIERSDDAFLRDRFTEFVATVLRFADRRSRPETRLIAFMFDVVYSCLTVSLFDPDFTHEDTDQFKLSIVPWDAEVNASEPDEPEWDRRTDVIWWRLSGLLNVTLRDPDIQPIFQRLQSRGFTFALLEPNEKREDWQDLANIGAYPP